MDSITCLRMVRVCHKHCLERDAIPSAGEERESLRVLSVAFGYDLILIRQLAKIAGSVISLSLAVGLFSAFPPAKCTVQSSQD